MSFIEAVESKNQLIAVWRDLVTDRHGSVNSHDGVCRMWADSDFGFWNAVTLVHSDIPDSDLTAQLEQAAIFMRSQKQSGYLWVFEDLIAPQTRAKLQPLAAAAGFELAFTGHGMAGEIDIPEPFHPELEMRRVRTEEDLHTYGEINGNAYGMPVEVGRFALAGSRMLLNSFAYIGYREGRPVACAATIAGPDSIFLALVATQPGEMRRGYGEAVTRKAIHEGIKHTGHQRVVLHATPAGRPVYERIGYVANSPIHFLQLAQR